MKPALLTTVLVGLVGCVTEPVGDIYAIWSEVRGVVRTSSGVPVSAATVELQLMYDGPAVGGEVTCQLGSSEEIVTTSTNQSGEFSEILQAESIFPPDCVHASVFPPAGSGLSLAVDTVLVRWSLKKATAPVTDVEIALVP